MKLVLPERFMLVVEGKLWNVRRRANIVPNELPHILGRLINGQWATSDAFEAFGLRVTIEESTDQGEDGPDGLSVPRWPE